MASRIVLGTRGSALAQWQASRVAELLREVHAGIEIEISIVRTEGDLEPHAPIDSLEERGIFVGLLERAVAERQVDAAVHSLKDMPTSATVGLRIAAILRRHDPRDALLSRQGWDLEGLPRGVVVATGSVRRRSMLLHARPDLVIMPVRGNVDTRVARLVEGQFDALVLALAGVERLGIASVEIVPLPPSRCLPAVGQGAIAVQVRADDEATARLLEPLDHPATAVCCAAERAFLRELGGGCLAPATAYARIEEGRLTVEAVVVHPAGRVLLCEREVGPPESGTSIGARLARRLSVAGAAEILEQARRAARA